MKAAKTPDAIARDFERFVDSGYRWTAFKDPLYRALSNSFGFIAHYDRGGFYAARFERDRVETLTIMAAPTPWSSTPTEVALRAVVERRGLVKGAVSDLRLEIEKTERAEYERLRAKYGSGRRAQSSNRSTG